MKMIETFAGLGGFGLAAKKVFPSTEVVAWSEIDKHAIKTFTKNFPELAGKNFGDIQRFVFDVDSRGRTEANEFRVGLLPDADLIVGGPPCQDLSIAKGKREGLDGAKSGLFWAFSEIIRIKKPKFFLMENVASMPREARDTITEYLECEPREINSDIFTPQKRKRLYWFNWDLHSRDISTNEYMALLPPPPRWENLVAWSSSNDYKDGVHVQKRERETRDGRANTCTTGNGCSSFSSKNYIVEIDGSRRLLHPWECEELQGLPHSWTDNLTKAQRYKQIGNAVTVPVVEWILRSMPYEG